MAHDRRGDPGRRLMINITWEIAVDGDTFEVSSKARDIINFERHFGVASTALAARKTRDADGNVELDSSHIRQEWLLYLAWSAAKRTGRFGGDFEAFLDALDEFPTIKAQEPAVPTNAGA